MDMRPPCEWQRRDERGEVMPWYTHPMLDILATWPLARWRVFEFGAGYSTKWYGTRCREVVTVEHDQVFCTSLRPELPPNVTLLHQPTEADYLAAINYGEKFDLIVVDGMWRDKCAQRAMDRIKPGGVVILDNAERPEILSSFAHVFRWNEHHSFPMPRHPDWKTDYWRVNVFERWDGLSAEAAAHLEKKRLGLGT